LAERLQFKKEHAMPPVIEIEGLTKSYGGHRGIIDIDLVVEEGEAFGFLGPNGAGKSTTMRIAMGLLAADSGQVRFREQTLSFAARLRIGYLPEQRGLYPKMRIIDQVAYFGQLHGMSSADARRSAVGLIEQLDVVAQPNAQLQTLSLGNQQRVQLAAALVHQPELLILDEPFAGLDPVGVDTMADVLGAWRAAGIGVLFSSHQLDLVERLCDRVGVVRAGRMAAVGAVDELRSRGPESIVVYAPDAPDGWADRIAGVSVTSHADGRTVVELAAGADDQAVLAAALATGPVREFTRARPTLTDLFRDLVTTDSNGSPS
jgi:ABC-2 type transport system ATP-binding protein